MIRTVSTAAQCQRLDAEAIARGVPGIALMELASKGVADVVLRRFGSARRVLVLCGSGNNGGDGYGAARWLALAGVDVRTEGFGKGPTGDAAIMEQAARNHGVREAEVGFEPEVLVDAVFGTGLQRPIVGAIAARLQELGARGLPTVAVDLPSGLHPDTGEVLGCSLPAVATVTFGRLKPAFYTGSSARVGDVECIDIGVDAQAHRTGTLLHGPALVLPAWEPGAHKNRRGHLGIVAGSLEMAGAAHLVCLGALASGVGLVTLFTPPEALTRLVGLPPEVMVRPLQPAQALGELADFDAVAVGPGLGGGRPLSEPLQQALAALLGSDSSVVADADALLPGQEVGPNVVRTPHPGEAARILGCTVAAIQRDRFGASAKLGGCTVLKGPYSLVRAGDTLGISPFCAPVLATAGSGDVLTGFIGGMLARGLSPFEAAALGVWCHGRAGLLLEAERREGWRASDIAAACTRALAELRCT